MKIKELKAKQTNANIVGDIVDLSQVREFNKFGKAGRVCNAVIKDDSGEVKLSLWNEQIDQVKKGDRVEIKNGYVNEWQGELQLTTGKFGTLEVVGKSSDESIQAATDDESDEKEAPEAEKVPAHAVAKDRKIEHSKTEDDEEETDEFDSEELDVEEEEIR